MPLVFSGSISLSNGVTVSPTFLTATQSVATSSFTTGVGITPYIPVVGSNLIGSETYSISPSLPSGLTIDSSTGQISGTPSTSSSSTSYTITISNSYGSSSSTTTIEVLVIPAGQQLWTLSPATNGYNLASAAGYYTTSSFVVPSGVTSVSIITIGSGAGGLYRDTYVCPVGGAGGGLAYRNNISVTPNETLTVAYGPGGGGTYVSNSSRRYASSSTVWRGTPFASGSELLCGATGGQSGWFSGSGASVVPTYGAVGDAYIPGVGASPSTRGSSGSDSTSGWGLGGKGGAGTYGTTINGGAGGAGGYGGAGGKGADYYTSITNATAGSNGGGGGGGKTSTNLVAGQGGGTPVTGQGTNGSAGGNGVGYVGGSGGGGAIANYTGQGSLYGGGGASMPLADWNTNNQIGQGGPGAVRIIWPGTTRQFPSTGTADQ